MKSILFKIMIMVMCPQGEYEELEKLAKRIGTTVENIIALDVHEKIGHKCVVKVSREE